MKWNDEMLNGGRVPMLVLVKDGVMHKFHGDHIDGVCAVMGESYVKNGKWSHSIYDIALADGVADFEIVKRLHGGPWLSEHDGWNSVAVYFGVERAEVERFFRSLTAYSKGCEILDRREEAVASIKNAPTY